MIMEESITKLEQFFDIRPTRQSKTWQGMKFGRELVNLHLSKPATFYLTERDGQPSEATVVVGRQ